MDFLTLFVLLAFTADELTARRIPSEVVTCPSVCTGSRRLGYEPGQSYTYSYRAQTDGHVTGTADQAATLGFSSDVTVEVLSFCEFLITFENVRTVGENANELSDALTRHPLQAGWQDGDVTEVCSHNNDPNWVLNLKRGFLSTLQNNENTEFLQNDVNGECMTSYERAQSSDGTVNMRKTKDLSNCVGDRFQINSAILFNKYEADSSRKSLFDSNQECNQTWSAVGVLEQSTCVETHLFRPFSYQKNGAETVVNQNIRLVSTQAFTDSGKQLTESEVRRTTIKFEHDDDQNTITDEQAEILSSLENVCDLLSNNAPSAEIPAAYLNIVIALKSLSEATIQSVWENIESGTICSEQQDKIRQMFLDAVPMCTSSECVKFSVTMINSDVIQSAEKQNWLSAFSSISNPNQEIIEAMLPLLQTTPPMTESFLTTGTLIYRFCSDKINCLKYTSVSQAIDLLQEPLGTNCHTTNEDASKRIILSLRSLGNAGLTTSGSSLSACAMEQRNQADVRIAAMSAFRRMPCDEDRSAMRSILSDVTEDSEIRIYGYVTLMKCPNLALVRHLVSMLENEEVNQVGSFIWSHIMEVKSSADPLKSYIQSLLAGTKLNDKFSKDKRKYSAYYEKSLYSETLNLGGELDGDLVWSTKSFIPRSARLNMTVNLFGAAINLFEIGGRAQGLERELERLFGPAAADNAFLSTILGVQNNREKRSAVTKYDDKVTEIQNRQDGDFKEEKPSAQIFMRMFGNEILYKSFGSEITEQSDPQSWFGGFRTLMQLATSGSEYSIRNHRLLIDSQVTMPTMAGFPLNLKVTGTSSVDVSVGGQLDVARVLFEGFNIQGHLRPKAAVEVLATMTSQLGQLTRAGLDLQSTMSSSMDINGTISLVDGQNFQLKIDAPQEKMDIFNYKSNIFVVEDSERSKIVPNSDVLSSQWCSKRGSDILGVQICSETINTLSSNLADDTAPFFPFNGNSEYSFSVRKTDPLLTHYLIETQYNWEQMEDSNMPQELTAHFFVGTPGSAVNRDSQLDLIFSANQNDVHMRVATSQNSIELIGNRVNTDSEKSAEISLIIDEMKTYKMAGNLNYEKSRIGGHIWNGNAYISTPETKNSRPTITGNLAYSNLQQFESSIEITNVLAEPITLQVDLEKVGGEIKSTYTGNAQVRLPGYLNFHSNLRSSSNKGDDKTQLTINYSVLNFKEETIRLSHKYKTSNSENGENWSVSTDVSLTQFPSLNHKISLKHKGTQTGYDSSINIAYGANYDDDNNIRRFAIKQVVSNFTNTDKTHLEGSWSLAITEYNIDYRATLTHIYDWNNEADKVVLLSGSFRQSKTSKPLSLHLRASDQSTSSLTNVETEGILSTPWGDLSALQRLSQIGEGRFHVFGNYGLGKAVGLQVQLVANITNVPETKQLSVHVYRPQSSNSNSISEDERSIGELVTWSAMQPSDVFEDIATFTATWNNDNSNLLNNEDYHTNGLFELESRWNDKLSLTGSLSKETSGSAPQTLTIKRFDVTFTHPTKELRFYTDFQQDNTNSLSPSVNSVLSTSTLVTRFEWTDDSSVKKHFAISNKFDRLMPKTDAIWETEENKINMKFQITHNEKSFEEYISPELNIDFNLFARPIPDISSYDLERAYGCTFSVTGPVSFSGNPLQLNTKFEIKFASLKDMSTKCMITTSFPLQVAILGMDIPSDIEFTKSLKIGSDSGIQFSADAVFDSEERFLVSGHLGIENDSRYVSNLILKQNLQRYFTLHDSFPKDMKLDLEFENNNSDMDLNVVARNNEVIVFETNSNFDYDNSRISIRVTHDIPLLINNNVLRNFQLVVRKSPNVDFGGSLILTSGTAEVLSARLSISRSTANENQHRFHLTVDHGITSLESVPQSSEAIVKITNLPRAFEVTVQTSIDDATSTSNFMIQLPTSELGFNINFDQTHDVELLLQAGIPSNSKFNLAVNENIDSVDVVMRMGEQRLKMILGLSEEVIRHSNKKRNTFEMDLSHNIDMLTARSFPLRFKTTLRAEDSTDSDSNSMTTVYSCHVTLEDEIVQSSLALVRSTDENIPVDLEVRISFSHDMQRLRNSEIPEEFEILASMQKISSGFNVRTSTSYGVVRKHFDVSVYSEELEGTTRYAAEILQNLETLNQLFNLPNRISASVDVVPVSLYFGFNVVGLLDLGERQSWRISTSFDGNSTSISYNIAHELSIPSIISQGFPANLQFTSQAFISTEDKLVSFDMEYMVDDVNEEMHLKLTAQDGRKQSEEIYQMNLDHTFETLTSLYGIPLSTQVVVTGKVIGWTYAKGNIEVTADNVEKFFRFHSGYRYDSDDKEYKFDYAMRHNLADQTDSGPVKISLTLRTEQPQSLSWDIGLLGERFRVGFNLDVTGSDLKYSLGYNMRHTFDSLLKYGVHKKQECSIVVHTGNENIFGYEIKLGTVKSEVSVVNKATYTPGNDEETLILELGTKQNMIGNFPKDISMEISVLREGLNKFSLSINSNVDDSKTHVEIVLTTEMESYQFLSRQIVEINRSDFDMFSGYIEDLKHFPTSAKVIYGTTRERNRKNIDFELSFPGSRRFQANFGVGPTRRNDNDIDAAFEITNTAVKLREFGIPDSVHGEITTRLESNSDFVTIVYSANVRTSDEQHMVVDVTYRQLPEDRYEISFITNQNFAILEEMLSYPRELQSTLRLTLSSQQTSIRIRLLFDDISRFVQVIAFTPSQTLGSQFQISRSFQISHDVTMLSEEWLVPQDIEFILDVSGRPGQDYELNFPLTMYRDLRTSVTINIHQSRFFETSLVYQGLIEEVEVTFLLQHESEVLSDLSMPRNSRINAKFQITSGTKLIEVETGFDSRENNIAIRTTNQVIAKGSKRAQNEASFSINHDVQQLSDYIPFTIKLTGRKMVRKVLPSFEVGATLWIGRNKIDLSSEGHPVPVSETQSGFSIRNSIDQDFLALSNVGVPKNMDVTVSTIPVETANGLGGTLRVGVNRNNNNVNSLVATVTKDNSEGTLSFKLNQDFAELINMNVPEEMQASVSAKYGLDENEIVLGLCFNDQCLQISPSYELDLSATIVKGSFKLEHRLDFLEEYAIPRSLELGFGAEVVSKGASVTFTSTYIDQKFDFYTGMNVSLTNGEWSIGGRIHHSIDALESVYGFPLASNWQISYENPRRGRSVWNYDFNFGERMMASRVISTTGVNPTSNDITITVSHTLDELREFGIPNEILISGALQEISSGFSFVGKLCFDELIANVTISGQKAANGKYEVILGNQHNFEASSLPQNFEFSLIIGTQANGAYITEVRTTRDRKVNLVRITSNSGYNSDSNTATFEANIQQDVTQELDVMSLWSKLASRIELSFEGTVNSNGADLNIHSAIDEGVFDVMYAHEKHSEDNWSVRGALTQTIPQLLDILPSHTTFTGDVNRIQNGFSSDIQLKYNDISDSVHVEVTKAFNEDTRRDEIVFVMNHDVKQWVGLPRQIRSTLYLGQDNVEISQTVNVGILCQFDQHQTHASFQSSIQQVNFPGSKPRSSIRYYIDIGHDYPSFEESYNIPQMVRFSMENTPIVNGMSSVTTFAKNQDEKRFSWTVTCGVNDETLRSEVMLEIEHNIETLSARLPTTLSASLYSVDHNGWSSRTLGCKFSSAEKSMESSISYILDFSDDISLRINMESEITEMQLLLEYIPGSITTTTNIQISKKSLSMSHEQTVNGVIQNFVLTSRLSTRNKQLSELSVTLNQNLNILKSFDVPTDSRIMFSYGTNSEPRSTISMDVIYGTKTIHATIVTSILENRIRSTVVFQHSFEELTACNIPGDIRIAGSSHWSASSFNVAFEYSFGDSGSQRGEITLSCGQNKDENNRMEWKLLVDQSFSILTSLSMPSEASVLLFYSSPNVNSYYTGLEIDADSYSIFLKTNIKARSNNDVNKFDLTVRGRQNVPYFLENDIPRVWRSVFKVLTQDQQSSISLQTTADGVDKTVLNIKSKAIWSSEIMSIQLNASYDISDIQQYVSMPVVGDVVFQMKSDKNAAKMSVFNIDLGQDFLVLNYKSEFNNDDSTAWIYNSQYDFKQNIEILSMFSLPKSGSSKVLAKLSLQSSYISMDSEVVQDLNATPAEFHFGLSFNTTDIATSGILSWNHTVGILSSFYVPNIFSLYSNIEVQGDSINSGFVFDMDNFNINILSDFGAYQANRYGWKSEIVILSGFVDNLSKNIKMESFVNLLENQVSGFGYSGKYGEYSISGSTTWKFSSASYQIMSMINHNIECMEQYVPNDVECNVMINKENDNNVNMVSEVITPTQENRLNIVVAVKENADKNNRQELIVSVNQTVPALTGRGIPNHNKFCLHYLIQETSFEVGVMSYLDEKNLVATFSAANSDVSTLSVISEIHHNFENIFNGRKLSASAQITDSINLHSTLLLDDMLDQPLELNISASAGKDTATKYEANVVLGHNIEMISSYIPFNMTGNAFVQCNNLLNGQAGIQIEADDKEVVFVQVDMTTTENSLTTSNLVRYLDPETKEMKSYSLSSMVKCNFGSKGSIISNVNMMNGDVPININGTIAFDFAMPNFKLTAIFNQNSNYLIENLQLPELVTGLVAIQLPTMSDYVLSGSVRLVVDENQPLVVESFTNAFVNMPGSSEHPWGKLDVISIFQHNISFLDDKAPNDATLNLNLARNGVLDLDFNFDLTSDGSKKFITSSTAQTTDVNNFTKLQLNVSQNLSEETMDLSIDLSGKLLENDEGFSYSINQEQNGIKKNVGEISYSKIFDESTQRNQLQLSFKHSVESLKDCYIPNNFELSAYTESQDNDVTVYSYNLQFDGTTNSFTLTLSPTSFDYVNTHDWVTLNLLTGLPYSTRFNGNIQGSSEYPFKTMELSYAGDLQKLQFTLGANKQVGSDTEYNIQGDISHNMKTWEILGMPMKNNINIIISTNQNKIEINSVTSVTDRVMSSQFSLIKGNALSYIMVISSNNNITKLSDYGYPDSMYMRSEISSTTDDMLDGSVVLSINEQVQLKLKLNANHQSQNWPESGSLDFTSSLTNKLDYLTRSGVPMSSEIVMSLDKTSSSTLSGTCDITVDDALVFKSSLNKMEESAFTFTIGFGDSYSISVRDFVAMNSGASGVNFEADFGTNDIMNSFGFRYDPTVLLDVSLAIKPAALPQLKPISLSALFIKNEDNITSGNAVLNIGEETLKVKLENAMSTFVSNNEWSVAYSTEIFTNVTVLTENLSMPELMKISEGTFVNNKPEMPFRYELVMTQGLDDTNMVTANVNVRNAQNGLTESSLSIDHEIQSLNDFVPSSFDIVVANKFELNDQSGWVNIFDGKYSSTNDIMAQFSLKAAMEYELNANTYTFEVGSSHKNIETLSTVLPLGIGENNTLSFNFSFHDVNDMVETAIYKIEKRIKVNLSSQERKVSFDGSVTSRNSGEEFSRNDIAINSIQDIPELQDFVKEFHFEAGTVSYTDSKKLNSKLSWINSNTQQNSYNLTAQYNGGFPLKIYDSHSLKITLSQLEEVDSKLYLNWDLDLSEDRQNSDIRMKINRTQEEVRMKGLFDATQPGVTEVEFMILEPNQLTLFEKLDISGSLTQKSKRSELKGRVAVDDIDPTLLTVSVNDLTNSGSNQFGKDFTLTIQPGLVALMWPDFNEKIFAKASLEKTDELTEVIVNCTRGHVTVSGDLLLDSQDNYITIDTNIQQPFESIMMYDLPNQLKTNIVFDARNQQRISSTFAVDSDELEHNVLLTGVLMQNYLNTIFGFESILRTSNNGSSDINFSLKLDNNTYGSDFNYTLQIATYQDSKSISFFLNGELACDENRNQLGIEFNEFGITLSTTKPMDHVLISVNSPIFDEVTMTFKNTLNQKESKYSMMFDFSTAISFESFVIFGDQTFTLSSGFMQDQKSSYIGTELSWKRTQPFLRLQVAQDKTSYDVIMVSATMLPNDWLQLRLSTDKKRFQSFVFDLDFLLKGIENYYDIVEEKSTAVAMRISKKLSAEQMEKFNYFMTKMFEFCDQSESMLKILVNEAKQASQFVKDAQVPNSLDGVNQQVENLIRSFGMPIDNLKEVYYESFINQLRNDVDNSMLSLLDSLVQTKIERMIVDSINEILNHNLDNLGRKVYSAVSGSIPPMDNLFEIEDELYVVTIPTVYNLDTSRGYPGVNTIRDWLAGTLVTTTIKDFMTYSLKDKYYRFLAAWQAESSFPFFSAHASVINGKQIVTFDGKVIDMKGSKCAHLLSRDFLDKNFSLIMQRSPDNIMAFMIKTLDQNGQDFTLQIRNDNTATINGDLVTLPFNNDITMISRDHAGVTASLHHKDIRLFCSNFFGTVCHLHLGSFYFGRVNGLMGTMDNEDYNDLMTSKGVIYTEEESQEGQDTWGVSPDSGAASCGAEFPQINECLVPENCEIFSSYDSTLRSCFPVLDPEPYFDACKRLSCTNKDACSLAQTYRMKCEKLGAKLSMPDHCSTCTPKIVTTAAPVLVNESKPIDTVFVIEQGECVESLKEKIPRLLRYMEASAQGIHRFGLVTYNSDSAQVVTVDNQGRLFGSLHDLEKMLRRFDAMETSSGRNMAISAVKEASLFPFEEIAKKNVILMSCSDCDKTNEISISQMSETFNDLGISFHLLKNEVIESSVDNNKRHLIVGYDNAGAYTKKSLRSRSFEPMPKVLKLIDVPKNDECASMLTFVTDGSIWNVGAMAKRSSAAGKTVTEAVSKKISDFGSILTPSGLVAEAMCRDCRCITVAPNGLARSVCTPC